MRALVVLLLAGCTVCPDGSLAAGWSGDLCPTEQEQGDSSGDGGPDGGFLLGTCELIGAVEGVPMHNHGSSDGAVWIGEAERRLAPAFSATGIFTSWVWDQPWHGTAVMENVDGTLSIQDLSTDAPLVWIHLDGPALDGSLDYGEVSNPVYTTEVQDGSWVGWAYYSAGVAGPTYLWNLTGTNVRGLTSSKGTVYQAGPSGSNLEPASAEGLHFRPTLGRCDYAEGLDSSGG